MYRHFLKVIFLVAIGCVVCSCLSVLKADRLVYAGSVGKKVDAVMIDSISKVQAGQDK